MHARCRDATATIRADFDQIARACPDEGWNHNAHYHGFLLRHIPQRCGEVLEVGCGTGAFARCLAGRADRVLALDLSPEMIEAARARSAAYANIDYCVADVTAWPLPVEHFDAIVCIATLHHLPMEETLARMRGALSAGGTLAILDLYRAAGWWDTAVQAGAVPVSLALKLLRNGRLREPRDAREAWRAHGQHDVYPTLASVRAACASQLPGARVRRHLLWRYSIIWRKPAGRQP